MSFSEGADFSAEHTKKPGLIERLTHERDIVGSTRAYAYALGVYYESVPAHAANMLQLKRMAGMVTNPNNEPSYPQNLTNAFYWGEILAYSSQDSLVGDTWPTISYKLFNRNIVEMLELAREETGSQREDAQYIADMMMGGLELADEETMPPLLDQFIQQLAGEITDSEEEQRQIIFGFRHIIMQVESVAEEYRHDDLNPVVAAEKKEFLAMMRGSEVDDIPVDIEPIDDVREFVMDKYVDHRQSYGDIDEENQDELDDVAFYLMQALNRDVVKSGYLDEDDLLQIGGNAVVVMYDENLRPKRTYVFGENEFIKGSFDAIAVTNTPTFDMIARLRRSHNDVDSDEATEIDDVNPLGVVLILKDSFMVSPGGVHFPLAPGAVVGVMLNNSDMYMSKYLL